ncbi:MAG: formate/nitrite transporter family protein [Tepidamorphaceae bacterium]
MTKRPRRRKSASSDIVDGETKESRKNEKPFEEHELEKIEEEAPSRAPVIFETIRRMGDDELSRPAMALAVSGFLAGVAIGLSVFSEALLRTHLPDTPWRPLIENFGYTIGFLVVILGQMQLFTENTITAVCPVLDTPRRSTVFAMLRLWAIVFAMNLVGASLFGLILFLTAGWQPNVWPAIAELSEHALSYGWMETMLRGVGAGWIIALLVWIMPNASASKPLVIILMTYLIALADFSHVVAGTAEAAVVVLTGTESLFEALGGFILPALTGNILGGTVFFTFLAWAQIKTELEQGKSG